MENIAYSMGIDQHKKTTRVAIRNKNSKIIKEFSMDNSNLSILDEVIKELNGKVSAAVEATGFYYWMVDHLRDLGVDTHLAHPLGLRLISRSKNKTDRNDAIRLSRYLHMGELPESYIPTKEEREIKEYLGTRDILVSVRTKVINRMRGIISKFNLKSPGSSLYGKSTIKKLKSLPLKGGFKKSMDELIETLIFLTDQIKRMDKEIEELAKRDEGVREVMGFSGFGALSSLYVRNLIGDHERFRDRKGIASFGGLTPRVKDTGDKHHTGHIDKQGVPKLRWIMVEVVQTMARTNPHAKRYFIYLSRRRGESCVYVAMARRLLVGLHASWRHKTEFDLSKCFKVPKVHKEKVYILRKRQNNRLVVNG